MKLAHLAWVAALAAGPFATVVAQTVSPAKAVKIIVPFSAGGIVDSVARLVGD
jgi:tripartite-type tricarboxylate transporter receptor subunit TctC